MPIFEPLTEAQKEFLPIVNDFLARADTQALHSIVERHVHDTEKLQGTFDMLQSTVEKLQNEIKQLRTSNEKYSLEVEKLRASNEKHSHETERLQGTVEKLQCSVQTFQGANEELRTSNSNLQSSSKNIVEKVSAIQGKLEVDLENLVNSLENKTRTNNQDFSERIDQLHDNTRAALRDLQKQLHQLDKHQQNNEQSLEQVVNVVHDLQVSMELQEARQGPYQDPPELSGHVPRKRNHGYLREDEVDDPHYLEGFKRHNRDNPQNDAAVRSNMLTKQPPRLDRQDAVKIANSNSQGLTIREAPNKMKKQPELNVFNDQEQVNPRFEAIKAHYKATKAVFNASQPKDQRKFIWKFIEESGDDEFRIWFQEHLLEVLSPEQVTRASKKPRHPGDRIIALNRSVTWQEIREVLRAMPEALPPFLE